MRYAPTLTGERDSEDQSPIPFSLRKATEDSFVFHPLPGMFGGRMRYAPTLTDERDSENRSAIPFSPQRGAGELISDPVISAKGFVRLWRVSCLFNEGRAERRQAFLFYQ